MMMMMEVAPPFLFVVFLKRTTDDSRPTPFHTPLMTLVLMSKNGLNVFNIANG